MAGGETRIIFECSLWRTLTQSPDAYFYKFGMEKGIAMRYDAIFRSADTKTDVVHHRRYGYGEILTASISSVTAGGGWGYGGEGMA